MDCGVLFSGGKDSTLAALLLDDFYDVTLVTVDFGITDDWRHAAETAATLDFAFDRASLDRDVAADAVATMVADGFPRNGIQAVHEHALEVVASEGFDAVADGTRRDDRVPTVSRAFAQSLEDRHGVDSLSPLAGFGRTAIDALVDRALVVETGPSEAVPKADYETELRALLRERGEPAVRDVFPDHEQSRVTARR